MSENNANNLSEKARTELSLFFQDSVDNIRFLKKQQWMVTNYVILLYVTIFGIHNHIDATFCEKYLLLTVAFSILLSGIYLIFKLHKSIVGFRMRLKEIRKNFDEESIKAWKAHNKPQHTSFWYNIEISLFLSGILLLGMIFISWLFLKT